MCVIMASLNSEVSKDQLEAGFKENIWGAGVAWLDTVEERDASGKKVKVPIVRWKKGIQTSDEVVELVKGIKPPYVVHFRIPTEGLEDIELTHPFPISATADIAFEGTTKGLLLFHNGGWADWRNFSLNTCSNFGAKLPQGILNDSRMMAWNAHHYGESILQIINEKAIVFGLNEDGSVHFSIYGTQKASNWEFKGDRNTETGIWFSNDKWEKHLPRPAATVTNLRDIKNLRRQPQGGRGGDHHQGDFRQQPGDGGNSTSRWAAAKRQMEGRKEAVPNGTDETGERSGSKLIESPEFIAKMAQVHQDDDQLAWALQINPKKYSRRSIGFIASAAANVVH